MKALKGLSKKEYLESRLRFNPRGKEKIAYHKAVEELYQLSGFIDCAKPQNTKLVFKRKEAKHFTFNNIGRGKNYSLVN